MARAEENPKIGAGHAGAMARMGLREVRNALYPSSDIAAQPTEYGVFGTKTPGEVAEARRADGKDMDEEKGESILAQKEREAESRDDRGREDRGLDKE